MSWNNNNYNGNNYGGNNYGGNNYGGNNYGGGNRNNGYNNGPAPKKSGATYTPIRKGKFEGFTIVNAWNKSRSKGLITAKVSPYKNSGSIHKAKTSGKEYMPMMCEINYTKTGNKMLFPVLMEMGSKKIVLDKIGMVITPNGSGRTASGKSVKGYFGSMFRR